MRVRQWKRVQGKVASCLPSMAAPLRPRSLRRTAARRLLLPLCLLLVCLGLDGAQEVQHPKAAGRQAKLHTQAVGRQVGGWVQR